MTAYHRDFSSHKKHGIEFVFLYKDEASCASPQQTALLFACNGYLWSFDDYSTALASPASLMFAIQTDF